MFLSFIIPIWVEFLRSGLWSYFVLPFFSLALILVFSRIIVNTVRYFTNV